MNAVYIRKRNESLQWIWACLAGIEFLIWSGLILQKFFGLSIDDGPAISAVLLPLLLLAIVSLGISALVHYVFACQRYIIAKGHKHASLTGFVILMFSFFSSLLLIVPASVGGRSLAAYFVVPAVFTLSALPLKLLPDRSFAKSS